MAREADEIRMPFSVQVRLPPPGRPGMPHRQLVVDHPAQGWEAGGSFAPVRQPSPLLLAQADRADLTPEEEPTDADSAPGFVVIMPDGSTIPDDKSPTGKLMAPVSDLRPVAAAGRQAKLNFDTMLGSLEGAAGAAPGLALETYINVGQGGKFDFQRSGNLLTGFIQIRQFRDVSNFDVGLFCQQAGLTLESTLRTAGSYAALWSSNYKPDQPYGLDPQTYKFIELGLRLGSLVHTMFINMVPNC